MTTEESYQAAVQFHRAGNLAEAEKIYRQILAQQPNQVRILNLMGVLSLQLGRRFDALAFLEKAVQIKPDYAPAQCNLGVALIGVGQNDCAIASFREVLRLDPNSPDAHSNLGNMLKEKGEIDQAIAHCREALRLKPDFVEALNNLGNALNCKSQYQEAAAAFREAIRLKPDFAEAHSNLGATLAEIGSVDEVMMCHRNAIRFRPEFAGAYCNLGNAAKDAGRLDEAIAAYRHAIQLGPGFVEPHSNLIFTIQFHPDYDREMIRQEQRAFNERFAVPFMGQMEPHRNDRTEDRPLRIGYVSSDFREHCQSLFTIPLFSNHDRQKFEIYAYSNSRQSDAATNRIRALANAWRPIAGMSDAEAAEKIRGDQIDILVDLAMHMSGGRLLVFARKPAPVQIAWLAYPGSTGLWSMDYRLTDPHLDPAGTEDHFYSEKSTRLPDTFWCYDPLSAEPGVNPSPAQTTGHICFGCLNNFCKVNPAVISLWARVLKKLDQSRMMILCPEGAHRQSVLQKFQNHGIAANRIELIKPRTRQKYLELYHHIDIGLDTFPYNGHTTSLDSYWMGVPVVTLVGNTVVGRAGLSQLTNLGLTDLIAHTPDEYVNIAAALAQDLPRLADLRRTLRDRMRASPLMDAPRFARNIESAYRRMWRDWCSAQ